MAHIDLAAIIGRAIGHQQNFRAALGQRLAHAEIAPDSSQIGMPSRTPRKLTGPASRAGLEHALLVELAIVRQVDLVALGEHLAAVGDDDRIVQPLLRLSGVPMITPGPPSAVSAEIVDRLLAGARKAGLQHQIFGG